MVFSSQPLGVRVRTRQLLEAEIVKITQTNDKAATQVGTALNAKSATDESQRAFKTLMLNTNVSRIHQFLYYFLSLFSASYKERVEATALKYCQFLLVDVKKFLPNTIDPLVDLCDDLFEFKPGVTLPIELHLPTGEIVYINKLYELMARCILPHADITKNWDDINKDWYSFFTEEESSQRGSDSFLTRPQPSQRTSNIFRSGIKPDPLSFFKRNDNILYGAKHRAFVAKAIQYSEVVAAKEPLDKLCAEMNKHCVKGLSYYGEILKQEKSVMKWVIKFTKLLSTAFKQPPLNEFFPKSDGSHELANAVMTYLLEDFLQFAEASSAPDGGRFAFFDSATSAENSLNNDKVAFIKKKLQAKSGDSGALNEAKEKLSKLMSAFMGNLKACLLSDRVKFKFPSNEQKMTFLEYFEAIADDWLNRADNGENTNRENLARLRGNYDNALKAFQAPLGEA
jgi:hypothetical protein